MAKKIYIGEMLEDLKNQVTTAMGDLEGEMSQMSADIKEMIEEISSLKNSFVYSVDKINIEPGNDNIITIPGKSGRDGGVDVATFASNASGMLNLKAVISGSPTSTSNLRIKEDNGPWTILGTAQANKSQDIDINITVKNNSSYIINYIINSSHYISMSDITLSYKLANIVEDGPIIVG